MNPTSPSNANPPYFGIKVSQPGINVNNATPDQLLYTNDYNTTTYYDQVNPRILIGLLPDGTYGFIVSKVGYDVTQLFSN